MTKLVFVEGVSGVGKTTLVRALEKRLKAAGCSVRAWVEFDHTNPIDFCCTAALTPPQLEELRKEYPDQSDALLRAAIPAGDWRLVRYYHGDEAVFPKPLLDTLAAHELCWHPRRPLPLTVYSDIYAAVWRDFAKGLEKAAEDCYLFDGALLFHPINDMLRNYGVSEERAARHVQRLLDALGDRPRSILYLRTENLPAQLALARAHRGEPAPTSEELAFWQTREACDRAVLGRISELVLYPDPSQGRERMQAEIVSFLLDEVASQRGKQEEPE